MSNVPKNLRAFLLSRPEIAALVNDRVFQNRVEQDAQAPYVWYQRSGVEYANCCDSGAGSLPVSVAFDVECVGAVADYQLLADAVRACHLHRGGFGEMQAQALMIQEQDDDYVPYSGEGDDGIHVASVRLVVYPRYC